MLTTVFSILIQAVGYYHYVLIAAVLMSWVPDIQRTKVGEILHRLTDWYLSIFRRFIPAIPLGGGYLDISPILAIFAWSFVDEGLLMIYSFLVGL